MNVRGLLLRLLGLHYVLARLAAVEEIISGGDGKSPTATVDEDYYGDYWQVPFESDGPMSECVACGFEYPHRDMVQCHRCWNYVCHFCYTTVEGVFGKKYDICEGCVTRFLQEG